MGHGCQLAQEWGIGAWVSTSPRDTVRSAQPAATATIQVGSNSVAGKSQFKFKYVGRRSICSCVTMSCMVVPIQVRCGCPMGLGWPGVECANSSWPTMTSLGLWAVCPSHLTLCHHAGLAGGGQQLSSGGATWAMVEAKPLPQAGIVRVSSCAPGVSVGVHEPAMSPPHHGQHHCRLELRTHHHPEENRIEGSDRREQPPPNSLSLSLSRH